MIVIMLATLESLFPENSARRFGEGASLFRRGDAVNSVFLVTGGQVHLVRDTQGGTRMILHRASSGDIPAEASLYSPVYHCDCLAAEETEIRIVPVAQFRNALIASPHLAEAWATRLARAVQVARMRAEIRSLRGVSDRLDAWLAEGHVMPVKGRWQDLAQELGVPREALYRELARRRRNV